MLTSFQRRFSNIKRKLNRASFSSTPVVEVATIEVPPPPGSTPVNTRFFEAVIDDTVEAPVAEVSAIHVTPDPRGDPGNSSTFETVTDDVVKPEHSKRNALADLRNIFIVKQKGKKRSKSITPVVEEVTIPPPATPGSGSCSTFDDVPEDLDNGESNVSVYSWNEFAQNYMLLSYYIAYALAIVLNTSEALKLDTHTKLAFFWIIAVCSVLDALENFKFLYLVKPVKGVIDMGYYLNVFLVRSSWVYVSFKRRNEIKELLEMSRKGRKYFQNSHNKRKVCKYIGLILGSSTLQCILRLIESGIDWDDWTVAEALEERAFELCHFTMVWNGNKTSSARQLIKSITDDVNFISAPLALLSFAMQTGALSHAHICMLILISIALYIKDMTLEFRAELSKSTSLVDGKIATNVWHMYLHLKAFSEKCNEIYASPVSFLQVESFMMGAFIVNDSIEFWENASIVMFLVCDLLRHAVFYTCLAISSKANEVFRAWVLKNFANETRVEVENGPSMTVYALIEELKSKPIGIRSNSSLITTAFIAQLVGAAVHIFFLLLDITRN